MSNRTPSPLNDLLSRSLSSHYLDAVRRNRRQRLAWEVAQKLAGRVLDKPYFAHLCEDDDFLYDEEAERAKMEEFNV